MSKRPKVQRIRTGVQILFFMIVVLIVAGHSLEEAGITIPLVGGASLHAVCPFGGVVTLYELVTQGAFIQKIHESSMILAIAALVLAVAFGPVLCGWICPFGTFQRALASIGKRIFGKRYGTFIPKKVDSILRYLRYGVLIWVLIATAVSAKLIFADYDPYYALFNFWTGEVAVTAFITLGIVILLSLFVERPFCRYACPYGALLGLTNTFRIFSLRRNAKSCISCGKCDAACPMAIEVSSAGTVRNHQCISCLKCTSEAACPVENTVSLAVGQFPTYEGKKATGRKATISTRLLALLSVIAILGTVLVTSLLGIWRTESLKVPKLITEGELAGSYDPGDIRGSYSFEDIEVNFEVPSEFLAASYGFTLEDAGTHLAKEIGEYFETFLEGTDTDMGTDSLRYLVSLYLGYPYETEEGTVIPLQAIALLQDAGRITAEQAETLKTVAIDISGFVTEGAQVPAEQEPAITVDESPVPESVLEIRGKDTFDDILSMGFTEEQVESALGSPMPDRDLVVRDYLVEQGKEFSEFKTKLEQLL